MSLFFGNVFHDVPLFEKMTNVVDTIVKFLEYHDKTLLKYNKLR